MNPLRRAALLAAIALPVHQLLAAGAPPVVVEAESGTLGADYLLSTDGATRAIAPATDLSRTPNTDCPGSAAKVASFTVSFPAAGTYNLYVRVRIGAGGADDDSFFYGNGFGTKSPTEQGEWVMANNLWNVGFTDANAVVTASDSLWGAGSVTTSGVWKWIQLSSGFFGEEGLQFAVPAAGPQTLQIGSRENGLEIDRIAFGPDGVYYTVAQLDAGLAGSTTPPAFAAAETGLPLAAGKSKFLGSCHSASQATGFLDYFNQVTPENAGKWGSVEQTRDTMRWTELDAAYNLARDNGLKFRFHILVWGSQQPAWISNLTTAEKREEIEEWYAAVAARYPDLDYIEVVNEPLHAPPNGETIAFSTNKAANYSDALGGAGASGWEWLVESFRLARRHFPGKKLVLNEYGLLNDGAQTARYVRIVDLLKAEDLVDVVSVQAHSFEIKSTPTNTLSANLATLAATGLELMITEMDIDDTAASPQLTDYRRIFPLFWEHPSMVGVTLWGFRPGLWRDSYGAALLAADGTEKPAMQWLQRYVRNNLPAIAPGQAFYVPAGTPAGTVLGTVAAADPDPSATLQGWTIVGGTAAAACAVDPTSGALRLAAPGALTVDLASTATVKLRVGDSIGTSEPATVVLRTAPAPWVAAQPADRSVAAGTAVSFTVAAVGEGPLAYQWFRNGQAVAGATAASFGPITADAGQHGATYHCEITNTHGQATSRNALLQVGTAFPPVIARQAHAIGATEGKSATPFVAADGATAFQWFRNGRPLGAGSAAWSIPAMTSTEVGLYDCLVTGPGGDTLSTPIVVGLVPASGQRTAGSVTTWAEWQDIRHPNGNTYDQFLLTGPAGTFTADAGQIARMSFLDPQGSIVQVEMSGAGAITVVLDPTTVSGPKAPALYNQSGIEYMQGKATIVLSGADTTTHFTIYSVGTFTNPGVTRPDAPYAGWADVAAAGVATVDGKLGGIHQGNAGYNADFGPTGLFAPGVASVASLVVVHDVTARGTAQPYLRFARGGAVQLKIAGGSLSQPNGDSVGVAGLSRLTMGAGLDSCGRDAPAQTIGSALLEPDGANVTATVVARP